VGDTIRVRLTCKQKTAKEDREGQIPQGVVAWDVEVSNQDGEAVALYTILTLVRRLGSAAPGGNGTHAGTDGERALAAEAPAAAGSPGAVARTQPGDAPGRYVQRGEVMAYVLEPGPSTVRAVVHQADVDLVRAATRGVAVKLADHIAETLEARIVREVPGASERLPGLALAVPGGGHFEVDPRSLVDPKEEASPRSVTPVFQFDLEVPAQPGVDALGMRVFVRFDHRPEPLARQWYRSVRRTLLRLFQVGNLQAYAFLFGLGIVGLIYITVFR
jgi:hypothetical protein